MHVVHGLKHLTAALEVASNDAFLFPLCTNCHKLRVLSLVNVANMTQIYKFSVVITSVGLLDQVPPQNTYLLFSG